MWWGLPNLCSRPAKTLINLRGKPELPPSKDKTTILPILINRGKDSRHQPENIDDGNFVGRALIARSRKNVSCRVYLKKNRSSQGRDEASEGRCSYSSCSPAGGSHNNHCKPMHLPSNDGMRNFGAIMKIHHEPRTVCRIVIAWLLSLT